MLTQTPGSDLSAASLAHKRTVLSKNNGYLYVHVPGPLTLNRWEPKTGN